MSGELVLGIDTSNYTTSMALVDREGKVVRDVRRLLSVRSGERGLRQQEALFQHVQNFPALSDSLFEGISRSAVKAVGVSVRPRPREGSYMPCFTAGEAAAHLVADALGVPCYTFSHQEGHIEAALPVSERKAQSDLFAPEKPFYAFHLSGGTCELLEVSEHRDEERFFGYDINIIGGTRDISFGQVLDRIGVFLGMDFPAGAKMDRIAQSAQETVKALPRIKVQDRYIHLSGYETGVRRFLGDTEQDPAGRQLTARREEAADYAGQDAVIRTIFADIADAIAKMTAGLGPTVLVGGVSESAFIKAALSGRKDLIYGAPGMGRDNAVGIAGLAGRVLWQENQSLSIS